MGSNLLIVNKFSYSDFLEDLKNKKALEMARKIINSHYFSYFKSDSNYYISLSNLAFDVLNSVKIENDLDNAVSLLNRHVFQTNNLKHKFQRNYSKYKKEKAIIDSIFIEKFIVGNKVLDYGFGKGHLANELSKKNFEVTGVDVIDFTNQDEIEVNYRFDRKENVINKTNKFDTVIIKNVLHHMVDDEILQTLSYLRKISKRVIVFEDIYEIEESDSEILNFTSSLNNDISKLETTDRKSVVNIIDFYGNVLAQGITQMSLPFNFKSNTKWIKVFKSVGFQKSYVENLGFLDHHIHGFFQSILIFE